MISNSGRWLSSLESSCTTVPRTKFGIRTYSGAGCISSLFFKIFKKTVAVELSGKPCFVNKKSLQNFIERNGLLDGFELSDTTIRRYIHALDIVQQYTSHLHDFRNKQENIQTILEELDSSEDLSPKEQQLFEELRVQQAEIDALCQTALCSPGDHPQTPLQHIMQKTEPEICSQEEQLASHTKKADECLQRAKKLLFQIQERREALSTLSTLGLTLPQQPLFEEEEDFWTQLVHSNNYSLVSVEETRTKKERLFVQRYNQQVQTTLCEDLKRIGLKLPEKQTFHDRDRFLRKVAAKNHYVFIPNEHHSLQEHPHLIPLAQLYELQATNRSPLFFDQASSVETIYKITKNGFYRPLLCTQLQKKGEGSSKIVYLVETWKQGGQETPWIKKVAALATIQAAQAHSVSQYQNMQSELIKETELSALLRTKQVPYIVKSHQIVRLNASGEIQDIGTLMEYCDGGTLLDFLTNNPTLSLKMKMSLLWELSQALSGLHAAGYCHHDLKLENILIKTEDDGQPHIRLSDFGSAEKIGESNPFQGTYMSPEQYEELSTNSHLHITSTPKSDLYVFANLIALLKYGIHPLESFTCESLSKQNELPIGQPSPSYDEVVRRYQDVHEKFVRFSAKAQDPTDRLMGRLYSPNPMERPSAEEIAHALQESLYKM